MPLVGIIALAVVALILIVGLVRVGMREDSGVDPLQRRLAEYGDREVPESLEEIELSLSMQERVIVPMYKWLARLAMRFNPEHQIEHIRHDLNWPASRSRWTRRLSSGSASR